LRHYTFRGFACHRPSHSPARKLLVCTCYKEGLSLDFDRRMDVQAWVYLALVLEGAVYPNCGDVSPNSVPQNQSSLHPDELAGEETACAAPASRARIYSRIRTCSRSFLRTSGRYSLFENIVLECLCFFNCLNL
jgi:hypothetical protein